ncbi:MAG: biotin transporter BioY [Actinobacteria bacterium]|nr:biotin transporter BioY [Actinomycetota bacterium]
MLVRALLFAALTGTGALIRIPTSPVPVTMQVFFVLLSGILLGPRWGAVSQLFYIGMGLCGAPFFAAPPYAGPAVLFGPTGGYLCGFVLAAAAAGWTSQRLASRQGMRLRFSGLGYLVAGAAGIAAIYACGTAWLGAWLGLHGASASAVYELGVKPFILVDLMKAAGAAAAASIAPRKWSLTI